MYLKNDRNINEISSGKLGRGAKTTSYYEQNVKGTQAKANHFKSYFTNKSHIQNLVSFHN